MPNFDSETGTGSTREELLQRVALMETMMAEGRRSTARYGWIFVLWGFIDLVPIGWQLAMPDSTWVETWCWPICISIGFVLTFLIRSLLQRGHSCAPTVRSRSLSAVWSVMGGAISLFCAGGIIAHLAGQNSYVAAILIMIAMAHGISAVVLRWRAQGIVACIWALGAFATFFSRSWKDYIAIFVFEMVFGMICFGLYAMMLERRGRGSRVVANA
jgi:hypothetical protein